MSKPKVLRPVAGMFAFAALSVQPGSIVWAAEGTVNQPFNLTVGTCR